MLISKAYAADTDTQPVANPATTIGTTTSEVLAEPVAPQQEFSSVFLPLLLIFCIFYFLLIRPQHKKLKAHQKMVLGLKKGDQVVTSGGIVGSVVKIDADSKSVEVEIAPTVVVTVLKHMLSELVDNSPIAKETAKTAKKKAKEK